MNSASEPVRVVFSSVWNVATSATGMPSFLLAYGEVHRGGFGRVVGTIVAVPSEADGARKMSRWLKGQLI